MDQWVGDKAYMRKRRQLSAKVAKIKQDFFKMTSMNKKIIALTERRQRKAERHVQRASAKANLEYENEVAQAARDYGPRIDSMQAITIIQNVSKKNDTRGQKNSDVCPIYFQ